MTVSFSSLACLHTHVLQSAAKIKIESRFCVLVRARISHKAFWRCGQALGALQRHADALEVYEGGVLAAKNAGASTKAFQKEMEKCQQKIEEEQKLLETTTASAKVDGATPPKTAPARSTADPIPESKATNTVKSTSEKKKNEAGATKDSSSNKLFTKSDHVRGYKIVNGKKTSYFHNELSEDAKKLIGDIAPKKLERVDVEEEKKNNSSDDKTSVWNTAGTWEERDTSPWAKETLTQALLSAEYSLPLSSPQPGAVVKITNVKSLNGHASIASVRGKRRYMYEFSTTLEWEMDIPSDGNTCTGSIEFPDIDGTCDGEYEMTNYTVKSVGTAGGAAKHLLDRFVKNGGLRDVLTEKLNEWVTLFQST